MLDFFNKNSANQRDVIGNLVYGTTFLLLCAVFDEEK